MSATASSRNTELLAGNKVRFLDLTIDFTVLALDSIFTETLDSLHLKSFIRRVVHYSGTTYSTLLTAILYLFRLNTMRTEHGENYLKHFRKNGGAGGERLFMGALIAAHKFLHDRTISTKAWSKLAQLPILQLNLDELEFLKAIQFHLFVTTHAFDKWSVLLRNTVMEGKAPVTMKHPSHKAKGSARAVYHPYHSHQLRPTQT